MRVGDIQRFLEDWAPPWAAEERDNVGLHLGDPAQRATHVLVALDVTPEVVREAIRKKAQLIVSHHPLLFRPPRSLRTDHVLGAMVHALARSGIAVLSAHTNLDFAPDGVSFALAARLGLTNVRFLHHLQDRLAKLVVFVPESHVEQVAAAMARAGAGIIGQYSDCSYRIAGTGTFRGSARTRPHLGKPLRLERVNEIRLEMLLPRVISERVIAAMKAAHPYEEVAYDLYNVQNSSPNAGEGVIGELPRPMTLKAFLGRVKKSLDARLVRFTGEVASRIQRIALCGGAGALLLEAAISARADAFLTADIRYHTFHEANGRIILIDAGHYETEHVILQPLAERLRAFARDQGERLTVSLTRHRTNPIQVF
jgi:dinuclear metal center YbgI/SA1388 family protein